MVVIRPATTEDLPAITEICIDSANTRSVDFHAGLGFREVGRLPGVGDKWGRRLDLVLMQRDLSWE